MATLILSHLLVAVAALLAGAVLTACLASSPRQTRKHGYDALEEHYAEMDGHR